VLSSNNAAIQRAYDVLRPKLLNEDRRAITINRLRNSGAADVDSPPGGGTRLRVEIPAAGRAVRA
jgi:hypothetical protein